MLLNPEMYSLLEDSGFEPRDLLLLLRSKGHFITTKKQLKISLVVCLEILIVFILEDWKIHMEEAKGYIGI